MKKRILLSLLTFLSVNSTFAIAPTLPEKEKISIKWKTQWSESIFKEAKKENKLIILDLEAIWCHWCHVMHKETYSDPIVQQLIESYFIPVRVDQDSRPDLANRYRDYGWPATIVFNPAGDEIIKRSGYIASEDFKEELQKVINDPTPEEPELDESKIHFSTKPFLSNELEKELENRVYSSYDQNLGGLKLPQKFLDGDSLEYCLIKAKSGNLITERMAKKTLDEAKVLIDPIWGGAYQYSTMGGWNYPHFERLATIQAKYLKIYAKAYSFWKDPLYLNNAKEIYRYLKSFLSNPDGVFYVSQDADVIQGKHSLEYFAKSNEERQKIGIPRVDKHIYSSQNGLIIEALVDFYNATGDKKYLDDAIHATEWIARHRLLKPSIQDNLKWIFLDWTSLENIKIAIQWILKNKAWPERGFRHDEADAAGPFLSDSLNMGRAFIILYNATNEKKWLIRAEQVSRFIDRHFTSPIAGFVTSEASCKVCAVRSPSRLIDENIEIVRFANRLFQKTHNFAYKEIAEHAMKYLVTPEIATKTLTEPGILIADMELQYLRN